MNNTQKVSLNERLNLIAVRVKFFMQPWIELFYGLKTRTIPVEWCTGIFVLVSLLFLFRTDVWAFRKLHLLLIYPRKSYLYVPYYLFTASTGFLFWAGLQTYRRRMLAKDLGEVFSCSGLRNKLGKLPCFIYDRPIDGYSRRLKITTARLPFSDFKKAKEAIESGLQVYVDDIRESREHGTIDITYSHLPMSSLFEMGDIKRVGPMQFLVGQTRAQAVKAHFEQVPHLLVAGQTSAGKSTFLRQFITSTYLNNKKFKFTLIDLKGGLEFQIFENLDRIRVISNLEQAAAVLGKFKHLLDERMKLLKLNKVKDLSAYLKLPEAKRQLVQDGGKSMALNRHFVVIDEAADIFLAGDGAHVGDIQKARRNLVELARKGRAVGVHLIFATQRPDARSIDSQVKANLPGIICFQMPNDASSMTVLGNGRATDLPPIPGRAVWKNGSEMLEIQTPYLSPERTEELLKAYRIANSESIKNPAESTKITASAETAVNSPKDELYDNFENA